MNIQECIKKGFLKKGEPDLELSEKENKESIYDLEKANNAYKEKDFKWCIVKCYYSMFHSAKSLLYNLGYIEKRHIAIVAVWDELNKLGKLESKYIAIFKGAMSAREQADYHYSYSKETAKFELENASAFIKAILEVRKKSDFFSI
jgi:uncharacterized protein (UPF0332 family)